MTKEIENGLSDKAIAIIAIDVIAITMNKACFTAIGRPLQLVLN